MDNINTTFSADIQQTIKTYYDKKMLMMAKPNLVFYEYAQKVVVPQNSGKVVQFRKWTPFKAQTTELFEGEIPNAQTLKMTSVEAIMNTYGGYVAVSDMLDLTAIDPVINDSVELMGDQGGLSIDTLIAQTITVGSTAQYAKGKTARNQIDSTCVLTVDDVRKAVRTLKNNNAPQFVRDGKGFYVAVVGPNTTYDLQEDKVWQDVSKYSNSEQIFSGEIGKLFGVVFVESTNSTIFKSAGSGGADVAATMIFGKNAYGAIELEGGNLHSIIKPKGSAGSADPLDQISTVGWKVVGFATKVLQPLWIVRLEHGISG